MCGEKADMRSLSELFICALFVTAKKFIHVCVYVTVEDEWMVPDVFHIH